MGTHYTLPYLSTKELRIWSIEHSINTSIWLSAWKPLESAHEMSTAKQVMKHRRVGEPGRPVNRDSDSQFRPGGSADWPRGSSKSSDGSSGEIQAHQTTFNGPWLAIRGETKTSGNTKRSLRGHHNDLMSHQEPLVKFDGCFNRDVSEEIPIHRA